MARVKLDHITKAYGKVLAVEDLNLDIGDGEFIALVGPRAAASPPRCAWSPG